MTVRELMRSLSGMPEDAEVEIVLLDDSDGSPREKDGFYCGEPRGVKLLADGVVQISQEAQ